MSGKILHSVLITCLIFGLASTSLSILASAFVNPGSPTIIQVSTNLDTFVAPTGSLEGGTILYIKGTNFSPFSSDNVITVGPYPCIL